MLIIQEETENDIPGIRLLHRSSFGGEYEAELVDRLRSANLILVSLVAVEGNEIVGHILFSILPVQIGDRAVKAAALSPISVAPKHQRQGIGSQLVTEGLARLRKKEIEAVIVLGNTAYYPRFGFSPTLAQNLASPFRGMPEFMGLELVSGSLFGQSGSVTYPEAFGL